MPYKKVCSSRENVQEIHWNLIEHNSGLRLMNAKNLKVFFFLCVCLFCFSWKTFLENFRIISRKAENFYVSAQLILVVMCMQYNISYICTVTYLYVSRISISAHSCVCENCKMQKKKPATCFCFVFF